MPTSKQSSHPPRPIIDRSTEDSDEENEEKEGDESESEEEEEETDIELLKSIVADQNVEFAQYKAIS